MRDLIDRQKAIDALEEPPKVPDTWSDESAIGEREQWEKDVKALNSLPSAQPEQPPYVAEIEAEYQKAVKMPHIHKPLAKALYEVWKKHDREDTERRTDERSD